MKEKKTEKTPVENPSTEEVKEETAKALSLEEEKINALTEEVEKFKAEADENKDKWMRSVAEFDNYKKRNANVYKEAFDNGKKEVLLKILPIGDNLENAVKMIADENTKNGVEMLLKSFTETLSNMGVEEIDPTGEEFDPEIAEAVMQADGEEGESGKVKQTFRKGYRMDGKIVRYAQVSVIK